MNVVGIIAILLAVFALLLISWDSSSGVRRNSPTQVVEPVFERIFGSLSPAPTLKVSSSYGYPTFEVTFASKAEMEGAGILNAEFKRDLNILFKDYGVDERRFDAELAAFFTYPGHIDELMLAFKKEPGQSPQTTRTFPPRV